MAKLNKVLRIDYDEKKSQLVFIALDPSRFYLLGQETILDCFQPKEISIHPAALVTLRVCPYRVNAKISLHADNSVSLLTKQNILRVTSNEISRSSGAEQWLNKAIIESTCETGIQMRQKREKKVGA